MVELNQKLQAPHEHVVPDLQVKNEYVCKVSVA